MQEDRELLDMGHSLPLRPSVEKSWAPLRGQWKHEMSREYDPVVIAKGMPELLEEAGNSHKRAVAQAHYGMLLKSRGNPEVQDEA